MRTYLLGVAGGSGSGKTYFAQALKNKLGPELCEIVYQDNFYLDQSKKFDFDGGSVNFDHPDAIEAGLLAQQLRQIKMGQQVEIPIYDFATHQRRPDTVTIPQRRLIIVDGILIFHYPEVRDLFDERVFFKTPEEIRYQRRLDRDVRERGRTAEGVRQQFQAQVKPMHDLFVEPSAQHAHVIVKDVGEYERILEAFVRKYHLVE